MKEIKSFSDLMKIRGGVIMLYAFGPIISLVVFGLFYIATLFV